MAVLPGLAGSKQRERSHRQAEIKPDAIEMTCTDSGAGQNEQAMLGRSLHSSSTSGRIASGPPSMMERPPIFTTCFSCLAVVGPVSIRGRFLRHRGNVERGPGDGRWGGKRDYRHASDKSERLACRCPSDGLDRLSRPPTARRPQLLLVQCSAKLLTPQAAGPAAGS